MPDRIPKLAVATTPHRKLGLMMGSGGMGQSGVVGSREQPRQQQHLTLILMLLGNETKQNKTLLIKRLGASRYPSLSL